MSKLANTTMLPPEIIFDIATRLPPKCIGRFRCVSTQWRSLLSQPNFIKSHTKRMLPFADESLLLAHTMTTSLYSASLRNNIAHQLFDEMSTCATDHDIVARHCFPIEGCATYDGLLFVQDDECIWLLLNPTTQQIRELPDPPCPLHPNRNPNHNMYGIGYDNVSDDYKLVAFTYGENVNVFSVRNGTWKGVPCSEEVDGVSTVNSGVFLNGRIHWINTQRFSPAIIGFDLVEESFCKVPTPRSVDGGSFLRNRLVVIGGCLSYISPVGKCCKIDIWVMKKYGIRKSWTKITVAEPEGSYLTPLTCMLGQPELVIEKDDKTVGKKLVMYNMDGGTWKDFMVDGFTDDEFFVRGTFKETLVSPYYI